MIYRADVPGVGAVYIQADSPYDAALLWQDRFLRKMGLKLPTGALVVPVKVDGAPAGTPQLRIIGNVPVLSQQSATHPSNTEPSGQASPQDGESPQQPGGGNASSNAATEYIVRITYPDGLVEYVRVRATSPAEARGIISGQYPSFVNISGANTAAFFNQNDPEFRQRAGDNLSSFVNSLDDKTLTGEGPAGQGNGQKDTPSDSTGSGNGSGGASTPPAQKPGDGTSQEVPSFTDLDGEYVAKLTDADGFVEYVRVRASSTEEARQILKSQVSMGVVIGPISTPQFLFDHDQDFVDIFRSSGASDPNAFVGTLRSYQAASADGGQSGGGNGNGGADGGNGSGGDTPPQLPQDIQDFPLPTFQNALEALGYDPNGVIGGLLNQRFDDIFPAFQVGSLTGTFDPIGNTPGSLQNFFETQFGNLGLAADVFRDLIAGNAASGLDAGSLLALQAFADPDFGSYEGRGKAGLVLDLAQAAAADRFGSFIARNLLPSNQRLLNEYERLIAAAGGVPDLSFLEFARQQNLLPAEF